MYVLAYTIINLRRTLMPEIYSSRQTNLVRFWLSSQSYYSCVKFNLSNTLQDHATLSSIKTCLPRSFSIFCSSLLHTCYVQCSTVSENCCVRIINATKRITKMEQTCLHNFSRRLRKENGTFYEFCAK